MYSGNCGIYIYIVPLCRVSSAYLNDEGTPTASDDYYIYNSRSPIQRWFISPKAIYQHSGECPDQAAQHNRKCSVLWTRGFAVDGCARREGNTHTIDTTSAHRKPIPTITPRSSLAVLPTIIACLLVYGAVFAANVFLTGLFDQPHMQSATYK